MTPPIRTATRSALATALLVAGTMACSGKSGSAPLASDLRGDLEAAQSSSIELANEGPRRTQVVSAEELTGATRAPQTVARATQRSTARGTAPSMERSPARKATTGREPGTAARPQDAPAAVVAPTPEVPVVVNADTLAPIVPRPEPSRPAGPPPRRGGYRSVGDVIRNAPFPINP